VPEASHAAHHQRPEMPSPSALDTSAGTVVGVAVPLVAQADADGNLRSIVSLLPIALVVLAAYLLLFRPEREKLRQQQEMLGGLKKNDRVVTASGMYGTVANVDRESDRVTLKVDDAANVKITVTLASIARVLGDRPAGDAASHSRDDA
jgi:preprotein translocase subunit YajC